MPDLGHDASLRVAVRVRGSGTLATVKRRPEFHPAPRESWHAVVVPGLTRGGRPANQAEPAVQSPLPPPSPIELRLAALEATVAALVLELRHGVDPTLVEVQEPDVDVANLREWLDEEVRVLHEALALVLSRLPVPRAPRGGTASTSTAANAAKAAGQASFDS